MADLIDLAAERHKRDQASDSEEDLEEDLPSAIDLMIKVVRGEQTLYEMGRWIADNYPERRRELPDHLREYPPR